MLYGTFRLIFWGTIFVILFFLLMKKSKITKKKLAAISILILCVSLGSISALFPVENLFINFKSPTNVLNYSQNGKADDVLHGNDSSMVIYSKGSNLGGYFIVPKSNKGYKIPSLFSVKKVSRKFDQDGSFDVYNVLGTNDYYVVGKIISTESEINAVDSNNVSVKNIVTEIGNTDTKVVLLYSFVENFTSEYYLIINGEKIAIS